MKKLVAARPDLKLASLTRGMTARLLDAGQIADLERNFKLR